MNDRLGARVLVGQFLLEANSFAPGSTGLSDFEAAGLYFRDGLQRDHLPASSELAAAWDVLAQAGSMLVPTVRAWVGARPPLTHEAWDTIKGAILERADDQIDGVYLSLHGASLADGVDDPEGQLLGQLRQRLRPGVPIAISLDSHAGWTPAMEAGCDIATAYRTVPHTDVARTGAQAARLLVRTLRGEVRPVVRSARLAMVAPADRQDSAVREFAEIMGLADSAEARPGILAAAFLPSHPWRDVPELCWSAIATADGDAVAASVAAGAIADQAWAMRDWFVSGERISMREALRRALELDPPAVVADAGDSPTGGSIGDSTELLRAALDHPGRRIWLAITDPGAARQARSADVGTVVRLTVGSGGTGDYNEATSIEAVVLALPDGYITYVGPFARGVSGDMGETALLGIGELRIVIHSRAVMEIDPAPYLAVGLQPQSAEVLGAKSHVSFRAGYGHVTDRFVVADTPGPTSLDLTTLPYRRRPTPLFPFERPTDRD